MSQRLTVGLLLATALAACQAPANTALIPGRVAPSIRTPESLRHSTTPAITVNAGAQGAKITGDVGGSETNMQTMDSTQPFYKAALASIPMHFGTFGDNGTHESVYCVGFGQNVPIPTNSTLDTFETHIAQPLGMQMEIRVPLGTSSACNGRATTAETAAWVAHENVAMHFGIKYWELGLYPFAPDTGDYGPPPYLIGDAALYGELSAEFSKAIKAVDHTAELGIAIQGLGTNWDKMAVKSGTYDFIIVPYNGAYAEPLSPPSDAYLLFDGVRDLDTNVAMVRSELQAAGKPATPIFFDDFTIDRGANNKQLMSITGSLYVMQALAEAMKLGIAATAWSAFGGNPCTPVNPVPYLYGWQNFSSDNLISEGLPNGQCPSAPSVPQGTIFPIGRAHELAAIFGRSGARILATKVAGSTVIRAYAATAGSGYSLFLFNLDESSAAAVSIQLENTKRSSFSATSVTYDKAIYDQTQSNVWASPITAAVGTVSKTFSLELPAWSGTVVELK